MRHQKPTSHAAHCQRRQRPGRRMAAGSLPSNSSNPPSAFKPYCPCWRGTVNPIFRVTKRGRETTDRPLPLLLSRKPRFHFTSLAGTQALRPAKRSTKGYPVVHWCKVAEVLEVLEVLKVAGRWRISEWSSRPPERRYTRQSGPCSALCSGIPGRKRHQAQHVAEKRPSALCLCFGCEVVARRARISMQHGHASVLHFLAWKGIGLGGAWHSPTNSGFHTRDDREATGLVVLRCRGRCRGVQIIHNQPHRPTTAQSSPPPTNWCKIHLISLSRSSIVPRLIELSLCSTAAAKVARLLLFHGSSATGATIMFES